jgi:hypothetical protein
MYDDFRAIDRRSGKPVHCAYQALIVAIVTRHADAVDIKFLADDRPVWIALPHAASRGYDQPTRLQGSAHSPELVAIDRIQSCSSAGEPLITDRIKLA